MRLRVLSEATVIRAVDGDTLLCRVVCPCCRVQSEQRVRIMGIDAPELTGGLAHMGEMAKAYLQQRLGGKVIALAIARTWPDKYGRILADVQIDGKRLSQELIKAGFAMPWDGKASTKPFPSKGPRSHMSEMSRAMFLQHLKIAPLE